jgi:peptidyl-prolyl cis-trans isomerase A (cyclophilin A)
MKKILMITASCLLMLGVQAQQKINKEDAALLKSVADGIYAKFLTNKGVIITVLEHKKTPMTVANFVALAEGTQENKVKALGVPYYNGLKFHRVIPNFMIQGGCPLGTGSGDPGYKFVDEIDTSLKHNGKGILSMANAGAGTNGSQFFITHKETPWLNGKHTVFGHVIQGQDIVDLIAGNDSMISVTILRKGKEAMAFNAPATFKKVQDEMVAKEAAKSAEMAAMSETIKIKYQTVTASGLRYNMIQLGRGAKPTTADKVSVHYTGKFIDGKVFDSSVQRGQPAEFGVTQVIPGWIEGLQLMPVGSKFEFYIPWNIAYGERGMGPIPAKSDLIFEVELLNIVK